jgi:hypothetical protein
MMKSERFMAGLLERYFVERRVMAGNCCIPAGFGKVKFLRISDRRRRFMGLFRRKTE